LQPRAPAYREAGWETSDEAAAYSNACRLERRPGVRERIAFLSHQAEELIAEKRQRIEAQLWAIHESDPGALWETYEVAKTSKDGKLATDQDGKMLTVRKQRPKLINDLPPELRRVIEDVAIDRNGNVIPKLYSKAQANADLRKLLNLGAQEYRPENDLARLSNEELIQGLRDQAQQLGVEIKLDYSFAQQPPATETDSAPVVDVEVTAQPPATEATGGTATAVNKAADVTVVDAAAADAARDLKIGLNPVVAGARRVKSRR
jgi:hypothetical protein